MDYKAVIFDFDYTLGDCTNGIVLSVNYALDKLGYSEHNVPFFKAVARSNPLLLIFLCKILNIILTEYVIIIA